MRSRAPPNEPGAIPSSYISWASQENICFAHPGYDGDFSSFVFLSLPRLDDGGVCYDTAITACGIIACNQWSGFFSVDKSGQRRVERPVDGILRDDEYYFHLPTSGAEPYPVVPRFSDWSFPHRNMPANWTSLQLQTSERLQDVAVNQRPPFCVATKYAHGVDVIHLVPTAEREWWSQNRMDLYGNQEALYYSSSGQDTPANLLPLRTDLHRVFDERQLCFVPKEVEEDDSTKRLRLLIHVVVRCRGGEIGGLWHNRSLHGVPPGLSKQCLFARFAYTILNPTVSSASFISGALMPLRLYVRNPETGIPAAKMHSPAECRKLMRHARSRSPRKRSVAPQDNDGDDEKTTVNSPEVSEYHKFVVESDDEPRRGRSRKRHFEAGDYDEDSRSWRLRRY
ncbi:hypothetical protein MAPG_05333 [Magnaporthiopsis poae ATCC 64411]|uniref:HNH nuclease domain-containing protein n=1 Tax=Magnaporthiopsis poae (strain ATCC 64411 / 73-15) TaxID=644358 RepID=A0A0C4DZ44_MAGP6|nr:hypothetical protein MAPG_05333 [Magnaporthiopsis poae ATCC 64411]